MYILTLCQEAEIRKFAVEKEVATVQEIASMTDRQIQELVFSHYTPILMESPSTQATTTKKDFYLIPKVVVEKWATLIPAERR